MSNVTRQRTVIPIGSSPHVAPKKTDKTTTNGSASSQPTVNLVQKDNRIEQIEVVCSCGEKIVINCEYQNQNG